MEVILTLNFGVKKSEHCALIETKKGKYQFADGKTHFELITWILNRTIEFHFWMIKAQTYLDFDGKNG